MVLFHLLLVSSNFTLIGLVLEPDLYFFKMGQSRPLFRLFSSFSHSNYNSNNTYWKKRCQCARTSNLGPQDGRRRQNHRAIAATLGTCSVCPRLFFFSHFGTRSKLFCLAVCVNHRQLYVYGVNHDEEKRIKKSRCWLHPQVILFNRDFPRPTKLMGLKNLTS